MEQNVLVLARSLFFVFEMCGHVFPGFISFLPTTGCMLQIIRLEKQQPTIVSSPFRWAQKPDQKRCDEIIRCFCHVIFRTSQPTLIFVSVEPDDDDDVLFVKSDRDHSAAFCHDCCCAAAALAPGSRNAACANPKTNSIPHTCPYPKTNGQPLRKQCPPQLEFRSFNNQSLATTRQYPVQAGQ